MKKKIFITGLSILLILSLAACSGEITLGLPTTEAVPDETAPTSETAAAQAPASTAADPVDSMSLASLQDAYIRIYEKVLPSVVSITASKTVSGFGFQIPELPDGFEMPDLPDGFELPQDSQPFEYQQSAAGSGFVWDTEGHIITNNHVVEGANVIQVIFADGRSEQAELVSANSDSDLAVLKINLPAEELTPIAVSDSTKVKVGQIAIAIGNPFQLASSMTTGIISGVGRSLPVSSNDSSGLYYSIPDVIQTDAAINPGNSGGVLVDIHGGLIGITTAIESPVRANSGVGYVIPSIIISKIVPILISDGEFQQPWIGISGHDLTPEIAKLMDLDAKQGGALVRDVTAGSPADTAGLLGSSIEATVNGVDILIGGDVIISADGIPVNDFEDLVAFLARYTIVGQTISLKVIRNGEEVNVDLTLAARPAEQASAAEAQPEEVSNGAWLGVMGQDVTSAIAEAMKLPRTTTGVLIEKITAGSPADDAGLRGSFKPTTIDGAEVLLGGDVITAAGKTEITGMQDLAGLINRSDPGSELALKIIRDGKSLTVAVTLGERPQ